MAPRVPLNARAYPGLLGDSYVCPSCMLQATGRASQRKNRYTLASSTKPIQLAARRGHPRRLHSIRNASNVPLASATAINAPTTVPSEYKELYQRLSALQENASGYVDLARLQLAVRSLESSSPVTRVAFVALGSNAPLAARKLARALLSDPLGEEEAWESEILADASDGRSLLLRYGDAETTSPSNPLVKTLSVPSRFLQRSNLELLITPLNSGGDLSTSSETAALSEAILVPSLTTPNSSEGRVGFIRYPVHKAIIVAEGVGGAIEFGRYSQALANNSLITAAISVPLRPSSEQDSSADAVDINLANHALELFRISNANGADFSEEWQRSRLPVLSEWILGSKDSSGPPMKPAMLGLISSVISNAYALVARSEALETGVASAATVPDIKRSALQSAISEWSAEAHRDLQLNLDTAFASSRTWTRTVWWRLSWRIDDVATSASELLRRSWLNEAEQRLAFLSGRILEEGLATADELRDPAPQLLDQSRREELEDYERDKAHTETVAELMQMPSMLARMQRQSGVNAQFNPPWPQTINLSRQYMLRTLVPNLHHKAQALLLTTLSTIGGSAALGAWFYVATRGLGLYESGAIVSLGLIWAIRRLQRRWSKERGDFANAVREDARRVLGEVESQLRKVVNEGGRVAVKVEDVQRWREARNAVDRCQEALNRIEAHD